MLDLSPQPILLAVPPEYRKYQDRRWGEHIMFTLIGLLQAWVFALDARTGKFAIWHLALIPVLTLFWWYRLSSGNYSIDKRRAVLTHFSGRSWNWRLVSWRDAIVFAMYDTTWRELPALAVRVAFRSEMPPSPCLLLLVYSPRDEHIVRDRVVPAIEHYRSQYNHEDWIAAKGWEMYTKPSELLADGRS